jgi:hypothetical protein
VRIVKTVSLLLATLLVLPAFLCIFPVVEAAPPRALGTVLSGSLNPGDIRSSSLNVNRDLSDYLFHYKITGGINASDVVYVSIDETGTTWQSLMGEGWSYCSCTLDAGTYTVTVEADSAASGPISYEVGFYLVPQPPVDFSGFIPANSTTRVSDFGILFPSSKNYTLVLGAAPGSYDLFVDDEYQGVVNSTRNLTLDLSADFHKFEVSSVGVSAYEDVGWTVQVQGQPKLEVSIVNPKSGGCNTQSGQVVCVLGAVATASDGKSPTVSYKWTANGGALNSTTTQWIKFTTPVEKVANFTLSVQASAPNYVSGTDSLKIPVPELSSLAVPLILALTLSLTLLVERRSRNSARTQKPKN